MKIKPNQHIIKNKKFVFSSPADEDAPLLAIYFKKLFHQSAKYLNFSEEYYDSEDVEKQRCFIQSINQEKSSCAIIIKHEDEIVGHLVLKNFGSERAAHRTTLAMGVLKQYHRLGLGTSLIELAQQSTDKLNIYAIELRVRDFNHAARHLYEKQQFIKVGEIQGAACVDGKFYNESLYVWNSKSFQLILEKQARSSM